MNDLSLQKFVTWSIMRPEWFFFRIILILDMYDNQYYWLKVGQLVQQGLGMAW